MCITIRSLQVPQHCLLAGLIDLLCYCVEQNHEHKLSIDYRSIIFDRWMKSHCVLDKKKIPLFLILNVHFSQSIGSSGRVYNHSGIPWSAQPCFWRSHPLIQIGQNCIAADLTVLLWLWSHSPGCPFSSTPTMHCSQISLWMQKRQLGHVARWLPGLKLGALAFLWNERQVKTMLMVIQNLLKFNIIPNTFKLVFPWKHKSS